MYQDQQGLQDNFLKCKEGEDEEEKRSVGKIISDWVGLRFCDALRESKKLLLDSWRLNSHHDFGIGIGVEIFSFTN